LLAGTGFQLATFRQMEAAGINPVVVCEAMNKPIIPFYVIHFSVSILLLLGGEWVLFGINAPLVLWRIYQIVVHQHLLTPAALGGEKVHGQKGISFSTKLIVALVVYCACFLGCLYKWFTC